MLYFSQDVFAEIIGDLVVLGGFEEFKRAHGDLVCEILDFHFLPLSDLRSEKEQIAPGKAGREKGYSKKTGRYKPSWLRNSFARSVCSHLNPWSSRPKWPYEAVLR